jgi:hypothetical protein
MALANLALFGFSQPTSLENRHVGIAPIDSLAADAHEARARRPLVSGDWGAAADGMYRRATMARTRGVATPAGRPQSHDPRTTEHDNCADNQ